MATPLLPLFHSLFVEKKVNVFIKRDDLIDPEISGNKWRKLKYNLAEAKRLGKKVLLSFGGAYSNHIYALAAAGKRNNLKTIGIIRGEEHQPLNPTLSFAKECGMQLHYMARSDYRHKSCEMLENLKSLYGEFYLIPEGGSNSFAVKGVAEIIEEITIAYDYICCACGTGGTLAGLIAGLKGQKQVLGFPVLKKGQFLYKEIEQLLNKNYHNWQLLTEYHFGGYAKVKKELLEFMQMFEQTFDIPLDAVYTGKMMFAIFDLIKKDYFPMDSTVIALHTGGLQGNMGMKQRGLLNKP